MQEKDTETASAVTTGKLTVIAGANTQKMSDMLGYTVSDVRNNMREVLNIDEGHTVVLVNGKEITDEYIVLGGTEVIEFKRPAGEKG
jgi:hypothetical protein